MATRQITARLISKWNFPQVDLTVFKQGERSSITLYLHHVEEGLVLDIRCQMVSDDIICIFHMTRHICLTSQPC